MTIVNLGDATARDATDPLAFTRARFDLPDGKIYLDGNSLGALPLAAHGALDAVIREQWGRDLVSSWNVHDWIGMPQRLGARIAPFVGAQTDEVLVCDTTSVNLFKLISAALELRPGRPDVVTEDSGFPTDIYVARRAARLAGRNVRAVDPAAVVDAITGDTALVLLSHVDYRSGRCHDIAKVTAAAQAKGALILWDLSHSCGAVPVDLGACNADMAVGCGYKYLNGGPGAPAWLFVARRLQSVVQSPLPGWMGHAAPFDFDQAYQPAPGIARFLCGTPSVLAMAALESGIETFTGVDRAALFAKGSALGDYFIELMDGWADGLGFELISPRLASERGSHVSYRHAHAYPICRAMIARGVVGDFRTPDILRLGFAPLYNSFSDVWRAVDALRDIMETQAWNHAEYRQRAFVT